MIVDTHKKPIKSQTKVKTKIITDKSKQNEKAKRHREKNIKLNETDPIDVTGKTRKCSCKDCDRAGQELPYTEFPYDKCKRPPYGGTCKQCNTKKAHKKAKQYENLDPEKETKVCNGECGKTLPLKCFDISRTGGSKGRKNMCKECDSAKDRKNRNFKPATKGTKICTGCKKELDVSCFDKDTYSSATGLQSRCKECRKTHHIKKCNENPYYFMSTVLLKDAKKRCEKTSKISRGIICTIDNIYLEKLYNELRVNPITNIEEIGLCAITGIKMTHIVNNTNASSDYHIKNPYNISIDRIDSSIGYTKSNVRLVCAIVNLIAWTLSDEELYLICSSIYYESINSTVRSFNKYMDSESLSIFFNNGKDYQPNPDKLDKYISKKISNVKGNAKSRNLSNDLTLDQVRDVFKKQGGKCRFTGKDLTLGTNKMTDMSIDRINSSKGYTKYNIQLVCSVINNMKSDLPDRKFIEYCTLIHKNFFQSRLAEYKNVARKIARKKRIK